MSQRYKTLLIALAVRWVLLPAFSLGTLVAASTKLVRVVHQQKRQMIMWHCHAHEDQRTHDMNTEDRYLYDALGYYHN